MGVFILPRSGTTLYIEEDRGCLLPGPYVDDNGEPDENLVHPHVYANTHTYIIIFIYMYIVYYYYYVYGYMCLNSVVDVQCI